MARAQPAGSGNFFAARIGFLIVRIRELMQLVSLIGNN
jgi:hypothetical protein